MISDQDKKEAVVIENWSVRVYDDDPIEGYGTPPMRLVGTPVNHPTVRMGEVHTSAIQETEGLYVRTKNRVYRLGKPAPFYLNEFLLKSPEGYDPLNPIPDEYVSHQRISAERRKAEKARPMAFTKKHLN